MGHPHDTCSTPSPVHATSAPCITCTLHTLLLHGQVPITQEDFKAAVTKINPSVSEKDLKRHEDWLATFGAV
jgi:hypothetical protein